jgi:cation diffusion facilitator family transporter
MHDERSPITEMSDTKNMAGHTALFLVGIGVVQVVMGTTLSESVALTANGIDCIGDGFVSSVVWVGLRFFRRPADQKFHYGYYKLENLASVTAAVVMVVLAVYIGIRSYVQLTNPHPIQTPLLGAAVALVAAVVAIALGLVKYRRSRQTNLSSVKLEAFNTVKDGAASLLTVVALVLASYGYPTADAIVGFVIALIILSVGFAAIKEAGYMLVDACDADCIDQGALIRHLVSQFEGVKKAHLVRLRRSGPVYQGELIIQVPGEMTIAEVDEVKREINGLLREKIPDLESLTITAAPYPEEGSGEKKRNER